MGVYIEGMKMPNSCAECPILNKCETVGRWITPSTANQLMERRHKSCPMQEVHLVVMRGEGDD